MNVGQGPSAGVDSQEVCFGDERLVLLPDRAVWLPARRALLVADVHLGKELVFRRNGVPVPDGPTAADLERLRLLSRMLQIQHLWVLGDLVHGRPSENLLCKIQSWCESLGAVQVHLVQGNHDRHGSSELARLDIKHYAAASLGRLALVHHAVAGNAFQIAGHLHPVARVTIGRHKALRVPAFILQAQQLIVPAFGEFTGGLLMPRSTGQIRFPILGNQVLRLA